ncbi:MAG: hypothetical protein N3G20_03910, partial [Verrucomicrobiae bacterium]|nr:hypothetical protein [Verrucomicrobiae bacterium]
MRTPLVLLLAVAVWWMSGRSGMGAEPRPARFDCLGVPVTKALLMGIVVGPDQTGKEECLYFNFAQTGSTLILVAVDPDTGEAKQYKAPVGSGAWAMVKGPDNRIYLGTWESGYILRFDPAAPQRGIQVLGRPSATETYIWQFAVGKDGKLYGCTYGQAKLVSCDPRTDQLEDLGRMDETQMYARSIACGPDGRVYTGIGYGRANIVSYDPVTGTKRSILPAELQTNTVAEVYLGVDGQVYARCGSHSFRIENDRLVRIEPEQASGPPKLVLRDGRVVTVGTVTGQTCTYTLTDPSTGARTTHAFKYHAEGALLIMLGRGPQEKVYGSSAMPLEMFVHDPATRKNFVLGNPTPVDGEIYSMVECANKLYLCAYPGAYLSVYDPSKPFGFGTNSTDNPRGFGYLGDGHLRPRAMVVGNDKLYIGSLPPYGELGGALAVFDLAAEKVVENYRHLVTNQSVVSLAWDEKRRCLL